MNSKFVGKASRLSQRHPMAVLLSAVAVLHVIVNLQFSGPTYTADEIGYLYNALTLSGAKIEAASSYHLGYALFLAPIFALQLGDWATWIGIVFVNTAFLLGALYFVNATLKVILPDEGGRLWAIGLCGIYPAMVAFSGYAFTQPAITFFFALACYALVRDKGSETQNLTVFGLAVGFLYWIHPTALALAVAAILALSFRCYVSRSSVFASALAVALIVTLMLLHKFIAHPALVDAMAPQNAGQQLHYPSIGSVFVQIANLESFARIFMRMSGQFLYLTLATLGLFAVGLFVMLRQVKEEFDVRSHNQIRSSLYAFIILSLLGVAAVSSMMFEAVQANRASHFFYGRYLESLALLPLAIAVIRWPVQAPVIKLISAIALIAFSVATFLVPMHDKVDWNNIQGFWQLGVTGYSVPLGFLVAAATLFGLNYFDRTQQMRIVAALFGLGIFNAQSFHRGEWQGRSAPSELPKLVRDAYPNASCIAYDPGQSKQPWRPTEDKDQHRQNLLDRRIRAYGYYLRDYEFRRMSKTEWRRSCNGPYLSADASSLEKADRVLATEDGFGLMIVGRASKQLSRSYRGITVSDTKKSASAASAPSS